MTQIINKSIFTKDIEFVGAATKKTNLQVFNLPEIAFFGKSNVGKSSLLNSLCNRKKLARVSKTPGCTRQINFFMIEQKFILADLPGYGYSQVSKAIANSWEKLILHYLANRATLRKIILLIDARRGLKIHDLQIIELLDKYGKIYDIAFTKIDQIKTNEISQLSSNTSDLLKRYSHRPKLFFTSSRTQESMQNLRLHLQQLFLE